MGECSSKWLDAGVIGYNGGWLCSNVLAFGCSWMQGCCDAVVVGYGSGWMQLDLVRCSGGCTQWWLYMVEYSGGWMWLDVLAFGCSWMQGCLDAVVAG